MTLQIGDAVGGGIRRAFTVSGGVLMALVFAYTVVFLGATQALFLELLPADLQSEVQGAGELGIVFPVPPAVAGAIMAVGMLFGFVLYLVATRALTRDQAELSSFPSELYTRRIGRATLSSIGASIVVQVAVTIGFVLLFVPGIFLAISFAFVVFAIGVEDERALDSLSRSWELASGNRWRLFALLLIIGVGGAVIGAVGGLFSFLGPIVGQLASLAITSVLAIVIYGVMAEAYLQLVDETAGGTGDVETRNDVGTAP